MVMNYIGNDITVYRKNKNGRYVQDISKTITNGIEGPSTGCFDESGVMYISNFNVNAIGVFCKRDGRYWTDEGRTITGNLIKPNAIGIDEEGVMYVTGYGGRYIWAFTRNSEGHFEFDGKKTILAKWIGSYSLRIHNNILYVVDYNQNHIDIYPLAEGHYRVLGKIFFYRRQTAHRYGV